MRLRYIGIRPEENGGTVPLPEGWEAADHNEPNEDRAAEKIDSGNYEQDDSAPAEETPTAAEEEN